MQKHDLEYHFPREVQAICYTERIAVDRCLLQSACFEESRKVRRLAAMKATGVNIWGGDIALWPRGWW